ncbi:serine/threonine-protein kinase [Streptomyces sp. NPDC046915]|uniref:serine/threonine-protein kinase n=1 Tax=Streptomyces sp. NPDC046915 TaxID=3155257 RepID=UPI0033C2E091
MSEDGERVPGVRLLGGRYRLIERIGIGIGGTGTGTGAEGGTGTVWRALDQSTRRYVAVKRPLPPGDPEDEEHTRAAHRLYREARAAARVDHPAAVRIHDVVLEDGLPWIVMEFVLGESLHTILERGPLPDAEAARIGLAVLGALRAAHAIGIVHRDVKPANVLLESGTGRVVLTDFGIGHAHGTGSPSGTDTGTGFVAPERRVEPGAGPASDLWSLGALLSAAIGNEPAPGGNEPVPAGSGPVPGGNEPVPGGVAAGLRPLVARLLAPEPAGRPEAEEVAAVLDAIAEDAGQSPPALTATPTTP